MLFEIITYTLIGIFVIPVVMVYFVVKNEHYLGRHHGRCSS